MNFSEILIGHAQLMVALAGLFEFLFACGNAIVSWSGLFAGFAQQRWRSLCAFYRTLRLAVGPFVKKEAERAERAIAASTLNQTAGVRQQ